MAEKYVNKVIAGKDVLIDLTEDTVDVDHLLVGKTAHDKSGKPIEGECTYDADTSDANAVASEIAANRSAYVKGKKVDGAMPNNEAVTGIIATKGEKYSVPLGYHNGAGEVFIDPEESDKLIPENIREGVRILGVTGEHIGDRNYVHVQSISSKVWIVQHNLNKYPSVTVVDSADTVVIGNVKYLDINSLRLEFTAPFTGKAYCN